MIDNDACFDEDDAVSAAVGEFRSDPGVGAFSFRVLDRESDAVDPRAWVFRRPAGSWAGCRFETFTFAGTGFCARTEAFRGAGGFWDAFRYAREEEDLALALLDRGWRLAYSPASPSGTSRTREAGSSWRREGGWSSARERSCSSTAFLFPSRRSRSRPGPRRCPCGPGA